MDYEIGGWTCQSLGSPNSEESTKPEYGVVVVVILIVVIGKEEEKEGKKEVMVVAVVVKKEEKKTKKIGKRKKKKKNWLDVLLVVEVFHWAPPKMMFQVVLVLYFTVLATGAPPSSSMIYADDKVQSYLTKFGYLPESNPETGNLRTEDQLRDAIRNLQRFSGIPVTGEIDDATRKLMKARRCGLSDRQNPRYSRTRRKRFTIHGQRWPYRNLTWSLRTNQPSGLETGGVRLELSKALDLWARNSKLTFQEVNSDRADILVYFHRGSHGDGYPFDGRGQILAHAFFPGKDRGGDAHFDEEEIWYLQDSSNEEGTSLFAVAAHEFGHSLGLAHSSVQGALMYPWYQGLSPNYELPEDDRHGIQQMYGAPEEKLWGNIPGGAFPPERPTPPTTTTTTTTTTTLATTYRPWRTRPTRPNHYPDYGRPRRPDRYPSKPDYRTERPDYRPQRPHKPHRHHTTTLPAITTTTVRPTISQRPRFRWTQSPRNDVPDKCDTTYDAISIIRREVFIFKGRYLWRIGDKGLYEGYPAEITRLFNLPEDIDHVDAVYERPDKKIVFFIGKKYYVFSANNLESGYPKPLTNLGLPASLEKIDGAMVWGHNSRTYFFSGSMYWRFDECVNYVELDYPRDISSNFGGVGNDIDAVFQWKDGKTYFFKGKGFWLFDDLRMKVAHEKQKLSAPFWMGCPRKLETNDVENNIPRKAKIVSSSADSIVSRLGAIIFTLIACVFVLA
ncbi:matrix metalloproteinase-2-like isoform X3 [Vespula pensylvanica]|uniref:matrix metalloproteinase-2-like isoform X3 n=1 Tax=Vespula pensylvanica TaxID=30213 RepID=UPI001CB9F445|nr:matrix metalloproteinase-2-like isoform X3 [Vespula pensylvanica]XP_043684642.1 matrix metalloproteinase-2-like isoform X3 [Vespula pensylvanica]XP_043684644.1 matrix metalloproteinase-2-like isoform X3 [Vespula pensylvanica]